jgi:hypothetical protein
MGAGAGVGVGAGATIVIIANAVLEGVEVPAALEANTR